MLMTKRLIVVAGNIGAGKTCYETPSFRKTEKESTYQEVYRQWDNYMQNQSIIGKVKYRMRAHPRVYKLAKWSYQSIKKTVQSF